MRAFSSYQDKIRNVHLSESEWRAKIVVVGSSSSRKNELCNILHSGYVPQSVRNGTSVVGAANYYLDLETNSGWIDALEYWDYNNCIRSIRCAPAGWVNTSGCKGSGPKRLSSQRSRNYSAGKNIARIRTHSKYSPVASPGTERNNIHQLISPKERSGFPSGITLWDTCGDERFRSLMGVYYSNVDIVLAVYKESHGVKGMNKALSYASDAIVESKNDTTNDKRTPLIVLICIVDSRYSEPQKRNQRDGKKNKSIHCMPTVGKPFIWTPLGMPEREIHIHNFVTVDLSADSSVQIREKCVLRPLAEISFIESPMQSVDLDSEVDTNTNVGRCASESSQHGVLYSIKKFLNSMCKCFQPRATQTNTWNEIYR